MKKTLFVLVLVLMISMGTSAEDLQVGLNSLVQKPAIPQIYTRIPILIYHHFADQWLGSNFYFTITTKVKDFEAQMRYLAENGYTTLTLEELYQLVQTAQPLPRKAVVLTFDDGFSSVYDYAYPILKKYNLKGTFFVIYDQVGKKASFLDPERSSWAELQEMEASGVLDIQSHTYDLHYKLPDRGKYGRWLPPALIGQAALVAHGNNPAEEEAYRQRILEDGRLAMEISEDKLGKKPLALAFPFGFYDQESLELCRQAGYEMMVKTYFGSKDEIWLEIGELERVYVRGYHRLRDFQELLKPFQESRFQVARWQASYTLWRF